MSVTWRQQLYSEPFFGSILQKKERTLDLKSLNLVFMKILFEFQTLFKLGKSVRDLLTLDLTSAKVPTKFSKQVTSSSIWSQIFGSCTWPLLLVMKAMSSAKSRNPRYLGRLVKRTPLNAIFVFTIFHDPVNN